MEEQAVPRHPITSLEDAIERCQILGMRLSRQRRYILELLWQHQGHLSAREIYDRLNQQGREIGHTSVYQTSTLCPSRASSNVWSVPTVVFTAT
jgi:Fur family ferric uptake transcriptional regulator